MMIEWLGIFFALVFTGIIAGLLAGLLGVGGGIVIVPVLFLVFQILDISAATAMSVAVGTSLLTIIPTSISSIRSHMTYSNVDLDLVKRWAPFIAIGAIAGSLMATKNSGEVASIIFGTVAIAVALNMLLRANASPIAQTLPHGAIQRIIATAIGCVSVIMGIGGGTLGVPILSSFNISTHRAVGSTAAFGLVIALPGALLMLALGTTPVDAPPGTIGLVNLYGFLVIVPLTIIMAPVGVRLGSRLKSANLKRVFAIFLVISATRMLYQSIL